MSRVRARAHTHGRSRLSPSRRRPPPSIAALEQLAPADVIVLSEPCRVARGWLERLRDAARGDTNTATASALADAAPQLALSDEDRPEEDFAQLADSLAEHTLRLRPRLSRAVGPCVYVRREALELVGPLDEELDLRWALEVDFAQRCLLSGLAHVAADDVVVRAARAGARTSSTERRRRSCRRCCSSAIHTCQSRPRSADSGVLTRALEAARGPRPRLWVTLDARALDGAVTGTQVHILELILALARTEALRLRLLVRAERIDRETLELLRGLPATEILAAEDLDPATPRSTVFHRPQQTFSPGDVALALALGERFVLSQLDLIAYRNPGYFADADAWEDYRARQPPRPVGRRAGGRLLRSHPPRAALRCARRGGAHQGRASRPGSPHLGRAAPPGGAGGWPQELARRPASCSAWARTSATRTGSSRCACSRRCARTTTGREASCSPGRTSRSDPRWSSSEPSWRSTPSCAMPWSTLGPVSEQEKAWLIAHAGAVVYPSVYEGFGLVPFESALERRPMRVRAPVLPGRGGARGDGDDRPLGPGGERGRRACSAHGSRAPARATCRRWPRLPRGLTWAAAASGDGRDLPRGGGGARA